jgi:ATP-dependent DNA ligase
MRRMGLDCRPRRSYELAMLSRPRALPAGFIVPCLPTTAPQPPSGDGWLHEIKHDGFRRPMHFSLWLV